MLPIHRPDGFTYVTFASPTLDTGAESPCTFSAVEAEGGVRRLVGYPVVWGAISSTGLDGRRYSFGPESIRWKSDVAALFHHDWAQPIARTTNGTLRMKADTFGWRAEIDLPDTQLGRDLYENVRTRLITGMSFGGFVRRANLSKNGEHYDVEQFAAHEITATMAPSMVETVLEVATPEVTQSNPHTLRNRAQRLQLQTAKLALHLPGIASDLGTR